MNKLLSDISESTSYDYCIGTCEEGEVKLVNETSTSISEGILQVCIDEEWFNICDEGWSSNEDNVVCRQLGYKSK